MKIIFNYLLGNRTKNVVFFVLLVLGAILIAAKLFIIDAGKPNALMGGVIQGRPLHLSGNVSTIAGASGKAGTTDGGIGEVAKFNSPHGITSDGTNLYVADTENNQIRKIELASGKVTTLAGGAIKEKGEGADGKGSEATFCSPTGITNDGANLYVADGCNHRIRKIVIATGLVSTLAGSHATYADEASISAFVPGSDDGVGKAATFNFPYGITTDGHNLFVTERNKIRKVVIETGMVTTLAGSGSSGNADGAAATFNQPMGISVEGNKLYIADSGNNAIRTVDIETGVVSTLAGAGIKGSADGIGTAASFSSPKDIAVKDHNLYVADSTNNAVRKINIETGSVTTLAGTSASKDGVGNGGTIDGAGNEASFSEPSGIAANGDNLYVADSGNHKVRKIGINSGVVSTVAGSGQSTLAEYGGDYGGGDVISDGIGTMGLFNEPAGITTDGKNLYVADSWNHRIRMIQIANPVVTTTIAGSGALGSKDGKGADASFDRPFGITTDGVNLYVADTFNNKIRKIAIDTGVVTTLAGNGSAGSRNGTGSAATFTMPFGITTDGKNLYVADTGNDKIRKIVIATGAVSTMAGSGTVGAADGKGAVASFNGPEGITTDGENLFVADTHNHAIRKIVILTGVVSTLAGGKSKDESDADDKNTRFSYPRGITTDGIKLYVSNSLRNRISRISISSEKVDVLAGSGQFGSEDGSGEKATFIKPAGIASDGKSLYISDSDNHTIRKIQ